MVIARKDERVVSPYCVRKFLLCRCASLSQASIDRAFLLMQCPLHEVATHLPVLKKAVAEANIAYKQYVTKRASEEKDREDVWKDERKTVEDVAKSLHFD